MGNCLNVVCVVCGKKSTDWPNHECSSKTEESLPTDKQQLKHAIALLSKVNKIIFDNCKHSLGELRCGSYLHSQINSIVSEQQACV